MTAHHARRFAAVGLAVFAAGCAQRSAVPFEQGASRYTFAIEIAEVAGQAGAFACFARVTDLVTKESIAVPAVQGRPGAPGRTSRASEASGATLDVELSVDAAGRVATCAAAVKKGGRLIASDTATRGGP